MPLTCILRGCKNIALPQHGEEVSVAFHRYELKTTHEYGFIVQDNNTKTKCSQFSFNIFNNTKIVCTDNIIF